VWSGSGNWTDLANWTDEMPPIAGQKVTIQGSVTLSSITPLIPTLTNNGTIAFSTTNAVLNVGDLVNLGTIMHNTNSAHHDTLHARTTGCGSCAPACSSEPARSSTATAEDTREQTVTMWTDSARGGIHAGVRGRRRRVRRETGGHGDHDRGDRSG